MGSSRRIVIRLAALAALVGVPAFAGSARAQDGCRQECWEARRVCHAAARAAHRACGARCEERVETAAERARRLCRERELEPRACMQVILYAVRHAAQGCREDCAQAMRRGRALCNEERLECHEACSGPLDPECVSQCFDEFAVCRDDLGVCTDACGTRAEEALGACRDVVDDRVAFLRCLRQVRRQAHQCTAACHEESPCGQELGPCVGTCASQP